MFCRCRRRRRTYIGVHDLYLHCCSTERNTYSNIVKMTLMDILVADEDKYYCQAKNLETHLNDESKHVELIVSSKLFLCITV